jgi:hypothetical protein
MLEYSPSTFSSARLTSTPGSSTTQNLVDGVIVPGALAAKYVENP